MQHKQITVPHKQARQIIMDCMIGPNRSKNKAFRSAALTVFDGLDSDAPVFVDIAPPPTCDGAYLVAMRRGERVPIVKLRPRVALYWLQDHGIAPKPEQPKNRYTPSVAAEAEPAPVKWTRSEDAYLIRLYIQDIPLSRIYTELYKYGHSKDATFKRIRYFLLCGTISKRAPATNAEVYNRKLCGDCRLWQKDARRDKEDNMVLMGTCRESGRRTERCDWCAKEKKP